MDASYASEPRMDRDWVGAESEPIALEQRATRLLQTLERAVIPRLVRAHRLTPRPGDPVPGRKRPGLGVDGFLDMLLRADDGPAVRRVDALLRRGVSVDTLYTDLFTPAARSLQCHWAEDRHGFADVTLATARLQRLMRGLAPRFHAEGARAPRPLRALLTVTPADQHVFGLSMVGEYFLRAGWDVRVCSGERAFDVVAVARDERFDLFGVSLGSQCHLPAASQLIAEVRRRSMNRGLRVIVGGPLVTFNPGVLSGLGCDAVAGDAAGAPQQAESLLSPRSIDF